MRIIPRYEGKSGAATVTGQAAKRAEMDGAGGMGAMACLLYAAFC